MKYKMRIFKSLAVIIKPKAVKCLKDLSSHVLSLTSKQKATKAFQIHESGPGTVFFKEYSTKGREANK